MLSVIGSKKWFKSNCPNTGCTYLSLIQTETEDFSGKPTKAFGLGRKKKNLIFAPNPSDQSFLSPVCLLSSPICLGSILPHPSINHPIKLTFLTASSHNTGAFSV